MALAMLRLIGIVLSIGLADSLNPSTLGPALYMAAGPRPRHTVAQFTAGVFLVYLLGGAVFAVGPGEIVLALVPKPDQTTRQVLEVVAGAVLITVGALLWSYRGRLGEKQLPDMKTGGRAGWLLGAMITAVELPTAFPYFAALAAVMGSGLGIVRQAILVVLFNVCFVVPLLVIIGILSFAGDRAESELARARDFLQRHWPVILAVVALLAGGITIALGATGTVRAAGKLAVKLLH
jgi:cytochrome c biogenesis protein CcdA